MEIKTKIKTIQYIEYDGIRFYSDKKGYWLSGRIPNANRPIRLHIYVWEKYNGKVAKGCHVHHIDGDSNNNNIENLKLLEIGEHMRYHNNNDIKKEMFRKNLEKNARPKAIEWHKSNEGSKWHKKHYEAMKDKLYKKVTITCLVCQKTIEVSKGGAGNKFCSNNCKSKYRRDKGLDNVKAKCVLCGIEFEKNKYSKKIYCSKKCSTKVNSKIALKKRTRNKLGQFV